MTKPSWSAPPTAKNTSKFDQLGIGAHVELAARLRAQRAPGNTGAVLLEDGSLPKREVPTPTNDFDQRVLSGSVELIVHLDLRERLFLQVQATESRLGPSDWLIRGDLVLFGTQTSARVSGMSLVSREHGSVDLFILNRSSASAIRATAARWKMGDMIDIDTTQFELQGKPANVTLRTGQISIEIGG